MNIGILGGGQLGWMTILEGRKLGFNFFVLEDKEDAPACRVADRCFKSSQVEEFYKLCDLITYEFEHISDDIIEKVRDKLLPNPQALLIKKSRIREKNFIKKLGLPAPEFREATTDTLKEKVLEIGFPAVVKAETLGYDGKGQYLVKELKDLEHIFRNHGKGDRFVVEQFVNFTSEISCIGVRNKEGELKFYPIPFNKHTEGILLYNYVPYKSLKKAEEITATLMEELDIVGVFTVEFFLLEDDRILINEFAPRVHNTGHWSLDGAFTSQFENLLRAITGLPLGSTELKVPTAMVNILGLDIKEIETEEILKIEGTKLYWYGKKKKPRRKVGHINIQDKDIENLQYKIQKVLKLLYSIRASKALI
ncbi:5-(carboxyamino)imidazole ribonucleotide synthase [Aquifex sp.]